MRNLKKMALMFAVIIAAAVAVPFTARAQTVAASGKTDSTDRRNIEKALEDTGSAELVSGQTYYLDTAIRIRSNETIDAAGATLVGEKIMIMNSTDSKSTGYKTAVNVTIRGGIWKNKQSSGYKKTMIQFAHSSGIKLQNLKVYTNYRGHGIELIGCKNVDIENCTLKAVGSCPSKCLEEQLQIDLATPKTAPGICKNWGSKYCNGLPCADITVESCTISGARALCANYASRESRYRKGKNFHKNIKIINCKLTGKSSEACALFNTISATVKGNKIVTKAPKSRGSYSIGLDIAMFGKAPKSASKSRIYITKNTIKGGRQAIWIYSHSSSKYGKVTIKSNKLYCKNGKSNCLRTSHVRRLKASKNKKYRW